MAAEYETNKSETERKQDMLRRAGVILSLEQIEAFGDKSVADIIMEVNKR